MEKRRFNQTSEPQRDNLAEGCYSTVAKFESELNPRHRAILAAWCQALDEAQSSEDEDRAYRIGSGLMEHLEQIGMLKRLLCAADS